jgi:hypothetical protein
MGRHGRTARLVPVGWLTAVLAIVGVGVIVAGALMAARHQGTSVLSLRVAASRVSVPAVASSAASAPSAGKAAASAGQHEATAPSGQSKALPANPLGAAAAAYLATRRGVVAAAVYDLDSGTTWTIGGSIAPQDEASIVKVDILETLFARYGDGLPKADQGLAQQMIEDSDNDAATTLWNAAGAAGGIGAYNTAAGLTRTVPSACVSCPGFPWPGWGLTTTQPLDQLTLLRLLVRPNPLISQADRSAALRLMQNVAPSQRWGVSGGVPTRVKVALKNGWLPLKATDTDWQINSMGWISGLGRNYLIAVLTTRNPTEAYGIDTIDGLSAMVWRELGDR